MKLKLLLLGCLLVLAEGKGVAGARRRTSAKLATGGEARAMKSSHRTSETSSKATKEDDAVMNVLARKVDKIGMQVDCPDGKCPADKDEGMKSPVPFHTQANVRSLMPPRTVVTHQRAAPPRYNSRYYRPRSMRPQYHLRNTRAPYYPRNTRYPYARTPRYPYYRSRYSRRFGSASAKPKKAIVKPSKSLGKCRPGRGSRRH